MKKSACRTAKIHPTAIIGAKASIADDVEIGPHALIENNVRIASGTRIGASAQILGHTNIGSGCHIFPFAVVGSIPQDLKYKGERSFLKIGSGNRIREFVTINVGTEKDSATVIGNDNLIMAYSHVAHDCVIGNNTILANAATLAGYVTVEDNVILGGLVAVHQFCRLGKFSIVGGCSKVVQDTPPYSLCDGHPARVRGINLVGLRRSQFSQSSRRNLKEAFRIMFFENHTFDKACEITAQNVEPCDEVKYLLDFVTSSRRGVSRGHREINLTSSLCPSHSADTSNE